ncbi:MAG: hypothetical protein KAW93_00865 [Methanogenium sp.]|nr:hypothetical protein [Methanogenium sp.]
MKLSEKKSAKRNSPNSPKLEGGIFYQKKTPQTPFFTKTYVSLGVWGVSFGCHAQKNNNKSTLCTNSLKETHQTPKLTHAGDL